MRLTKHLAMLFVLLLANGATAQSPREQLQQMAQQVQRAPGDSALREQIIRLAQTLRPLPTLPEEAERRMARGRAAFTGATSTAGYQDAAKEFEQATLAAPWYGDAYFNLGLAQDKAGGHEAALRSLKLAQLASPDSREIKALIYEVEYRYEKANSPDARAARDREREKEAVQRLMTSIEGARYICPEFRNSDDAWRVEIEVKNGKIGGANVITWISPRLTPGVNYSSNAFVGFRGLWFTGGEIPLQGRVSVKRTQYEEMRVELQEDRLVYLHQATYGGASAPTVHPAQTCLRAR